MHQMKTIKGTVRCWAMTKEEAIACGFDKEHIPSPESGRSEKSIPIMGAVLFDDYNMLVTYGEGNNMKYCDRMKFTDEETKLQLNRFKNRKEVNQTDAFVFMGLLNPSGTVRIVSDDPASTELWEILTTFELALAFERMKKFPKIRALLRQLCDERLAGKLHLETRQVVHAIRTTYLPELAYNEAMSAMRDAMDGDTEIVVV